MLFPAPQIFRVYGIGDDDARYPLRRQYCHPSVLVFTVDFVPVDRLELGLPLVTLGRQILTDLAAVILRVLGIRELYSTGIPLPFEAVVISLTDQPIAALPAIRG